jgi:hypothetical protein
LVKPTKAIKFFLQVENARVLNVRKGRKSCNEFAEI